MSKKSWYKRIIQKQQPSEPAEIGIEKQPEWVGHVFRELTQQSMPGFTFQHLETFGPGDLGRLVGQHRANLATLAKAKIRDAEAKRSLIEPFNDFAREMIAAAWNEASQEERVSFFQGLAQGLSKPGIVDGAPARATTATVIYQILLVAHEQVNRLKSVRELREFLLARGLTNQSLGEPKRLEKLCQRIGLTFADPGRPKRTN